MKHFGDITKLNGAELPVVDCITGGSPCQDLSVAGKRAGLAGERSGLFMEQIRIIKEMREHDRRSNGRTGWHVRPRYMVWENVPGAFSSNGGADFGAVLSEIARVEEPEAPDVLMPDGGGWPHSGCIYSEVGVWSIAWRLHDAQFWGVPQRRKRIALVADFGGLSAPEILFERKGLRWDTAEGGKAEQGATRRAENSTRDTISFQERGGKPGGGKGILIQNEHVGALSTLNNQAIFDARGNGDGRTVPTLTGDHQNRVTDYTALVLETYHCTTEEDVVQTLKARDYKDPQSVLALENHPGQGSVVRRPTPTECERLQGYPDGWTDIGPWTDSNGKLHKESSDSARYKALGNSIALPFWFYLLRRISAQYERPATLGSLFDGIGGFPLCWERCNGRGTALWASEIEEFPVAVTKVHFPEVAL